MVTCVTPIVRPRTNQVKGPIVTEAMKVHSVMSPGHLESACEACGLHELQTQGLTAERQVLVPVVYDGVTIDPGYRTDILVEDLVVVEWWKLKWCRGSQSDPQSPTPVILESQWRACGPAG